MTLKRFYKAHTILILAICIFFFSLGIRMWNLGEAGQVFDEKSLLRDYAWHHVLDAKNLHFTSDNWWKLTPDHTPLVRYLRGAASLGDIAGWERNGWPVFTYELRTNRLLSVVLTALGSVIVFLIGTRYISRFSGVAGAMIFSMMPIVLGHSQIAMLEALALFFFPLSMYTFFLFLEKPTTTRMIWAGIALGFAVLARETHVMLVPMMVLILFIKWRFTRIKDVSAVIKKLAGLFVISFLTFFIVWPQPFFHLDYLYAYTTDIRFSVRTPIPEVIYGKLMLAPVFYYVLYFLITTPLLILVLMLIGLLKINKSKNWIWYALVIWFCFPFLMSFYHNRQQGIRYIIQITIPVSLIAAMGVETLRRYFPKKIRYTYLVLAFLFLYQFSILWRITPYYIDYFNILVGGPKNVYEKRLFHLAWWGEGIKEAVDYLNLHAPKGATIGIATAPDHILPPLPGKKVSPYQDTKTYDFVIINYYKIVREGFDDTTIRKNYRVIYCVMADGACLTQVYQRK